VTCDNHGVDSARKNFFGFASSKLLPGVLIVLLVFIAYFPALRGQFLWDDDRNVTGNMPLRTLDGLRQIWFELGATQQYYPLTHTSFWVEYHLWALNPLGYHVVNVLLQGVNAILLWLILLRLRVPGAWLGAAIFALHPVQVESVAWITERKNMLSGFFYLSSIWACLKFWLPEQAASGSNVTPPQVSDASHHGPWKFYGLGLALYLFALWSKTATVALPAVILLLLWWKCGKVGRRNIYLLLPFLVVGIVTGLITLWVEEQMCVTGPEWNFSFVERGIIAGRALWFYLGKLFWPHPLMFMYPRWTIDTSKWTAYLPIFAGVLGLVVLWQERNGWARPVLCAIGYFIAVLFPVLGFLNVFFFRFSFVCDHFQYLASIGPLVLAAAGITTVLDLFQKRAPFLKPLICGMLLVLLGGLTWQQTWLYRDNITLWRDALLKNENAWNAHIMVGCCLSDIGRYDDALVHFRKAIEIIPNDESAYIDCAVALAKSGRLDEAEAEFKEAIRIQPNRHLAHANYCTLLLYRGKLDAAYEEIQKLMLIAPQSAQPHNAYGLYLILRGRLNDAEAEVQTARQLGPDSADTHINQALILEKRGQLNEAAQEYEYILQLDPTSQWGRIGLADTLCALNKWRLAIPYYQDLLRSDSSNNDIRVRLGMALIEIRDFTGAESEFPPCSKPIPGMQKPLMVLGTRWPCKASWARPGRGSSSPCSLTQKMRIRICTMQFVCRPNDRLAKP
jgi:tetratricopeptide (TPR) repeat protein